MSKPEQTVLPVVAWADSDGAVVRADSKLRHPVAFEMYSGALTPLAEAQAEIERLTAEHATALDRQALYLALTRDAQRVATEANARAEAALADAAKHLRLHVEFSWIAHNLYLAMSGAVIEAEIGRGPDAGVQWIENTLLGPGLYPDLDEARDLGGAQAWFNAKMAEGDAQRKAAALVATVETGA